MCGTKPLNPFFRFHEASEVLNKYVIGNGSVAGPSPGFRSKWGKNHKVGPHFLNTIFSFF